jgi:Mn-dependent DtxR family transcriptional regulator
MALFTGELGPIDEDGYQGVRVLEDGVVVETHYLRYDMASQWLAQELAIRQSMADADGQLCEHGMSLALCGGPMHWYD